MISKIFSWLYIGDCTSGSDLAIIRYLSVKTIINVHREHKDTILSDIPCYQIPLIEAPGNDWGTVIEILKVLADSREDGSVLVHCCGAVSRSPFVVLCYLVMSEKMTISQASGRLSYLHPTTHINSDLFELLRRNRPSTRT